MTDFVRHRGEIEHVTNRVVSVRILQFSSCSGCSVAKLCQSSETKEKIVNVRRQSGKEYHVGDEVVVVGSVSQGLKATVWAYALPLFLVVASIVLANMFGANDALSAFVSLVVLVLYYCAMYFLRNRFNKKFHFEIEY